MINKHVKNKVYLVRLSAIGDVVMTAHAVNWLYFKGFTPVLITSHNLEPIASHMIHLNHLILWDSHLLESIKYLQRDGHPKSFSPVTYFSDFLENSMSNNCFDLQVTGKSRFLIKRVKKFMQFSKTASVPKHSLFRIFSVIRARLSWSQYPKLNTKFIRGSILNTQINFLQSNLTDKNFNISNSQNNTFQPTLATTRSVPKEICKTDKYVCLCPSASSFEKRWPKEHFRELMKLILNQTDFSIVICGGKDATDIGEFLEFPKSKRIINGIGRWDLYETLAVLANASYAVVNDSFASHACDGFGTPASVMFGPTSPAFGFAPLNHFITIHYSDLSCSPCSRHGKGSCRFNNLACLKSITPESIFKVLIDNFKKI